MIHLRGLSIASSGERNFPFSVPALKDLELELVRPVTLFVGENGSGKSTLLEALACATSTIGVGSYSLDRDPTLDAIRPLARSMRLVWNRPVHRGFFMRAEDFFGFVNRVKAEQATFEREAARVRAENPDVAAPDLARMLGPHVGSAGALADRYGEDMDARSHGQQFLAFFQSRLVSGGLYLLDEPEVALSPTSQLAFLGLLMDASRDADCQFLIATHSPILMALPDATILSFDDPPVRQIEYDEAEHVRLTRDFLEAPERFLRHL
ncbi:MAG: AAA family ATPase [Gemmatimonadota bacterium]